MLLTPPLLPFILTLLTWIIKLAFVLVSILAVSIALSNAFGPDKNYQQRINDDSELDEQTDEQEDKPSKLEIKTGSFIKVKNFKAHTIFGHSFWGIIRPN